MDGRRDFQGPWKTQIRLHLVAFQFHSCAGSWWHPKAEASKGGLILGNGQFLGFT